MSPLLWAILCGILIVALAMGLMVWEVRQETHYQRLARKAQEDQELGYSKFREDPNADPRDWN